MAYDARQIANWFIKRAAEEQRELSVMSLLKLAYIAHGWNLELRDEPLFDNRIEAWQYGPVIPDVYRTYRKQGVQISEPVPVSGREIAEADARFLDEIYRKYAKRSAFELSDLTHVEGGPWAIASELGGNYAEIPNDLIKQHYEMKRLKANSARANG